MPASFSICLSVSLYAWSLLKICFRVGRASTHFKGYVYWIGYILMSLLMMMMMMNE